MKNVSKKKFCLRSKSLFPFSAQVSSIYWLGEDLGLTKVPISISNQVGFTPWVLYSSTVTSLKKVSSNQKLVELKMLGFSYHERTGILTSADYYYHTTYYPVFFDQDSLISHKFEVSITFHIMKTVNFILGPKKDSSLMILFH